MLSFLPQNTLFSLALCRRACPECFDWGSRTENPEQCQIQFEINFYGAIHAACTRTRLNWRRNFPIIGTCVLNSSRKLKLPWARHLWQAAYKKTELNLPNLHLFCQFPPIMAKWVAVYNGLSLNLRNPNHPKMVQHQLCTCPFKHRCLAVQKVIHFLWQLAHGGPH